MTTIANGVMVFPRGRHPFLWRVMQNVAYRVHPSKNVRFWEYFRFACFLEQEQRLSSVAAKCVPKSICIPFFATDGYHVACDIPEDLHAGGFPGIICNSVGRAAYVPNLVADALQNAILETAA